MKKLIIVVLLMISGCSWVTLEDLRELNKDCCCEEKKKEINNGK